VRHELPDRSHLFDRKEEIALNSGDGQRYDRLSPAGKGKAGGILENNGKLKAYG
jgi:hypothetical protein